MTDALIGIDLSGVEHVPSGRTGELTFQRLPDVIARLETERLAADEAIRVERGVDRFYRAATTCERLLLTHLGYRLPAASAARNESEVARRHQTPDMATTPERKDCPMIYDDDAVAEADLSGLVHRGWTDVRGWLVYDRPLPPPLQQREDSRQHADDEHPHWPGTHWTRPATLAERLLLASLGFVVPPGLQTVVRFPSGGVRRREWPALVSQFERMTSNDSE